MLLYFGYSLESVEEIWQFRKTFFKNWQTMAIFFKIILYLLQDHPAAADGVVGTNSCKTRYLEDDDIKRKPMSLLLPDGHANVRGVQRQQSAGLVLS
jgi:hypothetical protein